MEVGDAVRINYRRRAGSRVPLDGGRDTKQRGEDEAVVSAAAIVAAVLAVNARVLVVAGEGEGVGARVGGVVGGRRRSSACK